MTSSGQDDDGENSSKTQYLLFLFLVCTWCVQIFAKFQSALYSHMFTYPVNALFYVCGPIFPILPFIAGLERWWIEKNGLGVLGHAPLPL